MFRTPLRAFLIVALAGLAGAHSAAASDAIKAGFISTSLASIPIIVADANGYFKDEGLDATLVGFESSDFDRPGGRQRRYRFRHHRPQQSVLRACQ